MSFNRFTVALASVNDPAPKLLALTCNLYAAVLEAEAYGKNADTDPAVLLLNMQVSFITNVDHAIATTFDSLIDACQVNAARPNIEPHKVN